MSSLLDEARAKLAKEKADAMARQAKEKADSERRIQKEKERNERIRRQFLNEIKQRFLAQALQLLPNVCEMICLWHNVNTDQSPEDLAKTIFDLSDGVKFHEYNIGNEELPLLQERRNYEKSCFYYAWAIKFTVFELNIYLIPYKDIQKGFACVVGREGRGFINRSPNDIDRDYAIQLIAEYIQKHPKYQRS